MTGDRSPVVAFGLYAVTCAMRAKTGALTAEALDELAGKRAQLLPDRADLAEAVSRFDAGVTEGEPEEAADAFLAVVGDLAEGHARRLAGALDNAGFAWQSRKDLA
ncbi:hypothetical protein SAMN05444336_101276 [Albimonas donghaensis]|uniref:Uncharacterized protein n=1 Tax=Albimonas donghaensis TaxID=356660 RepID=A0A1H2R904_9RHOB|nr:hypothetical protein [Albimonas donghaensis]SDW15953.1 hypothetical protein SAMN05444336_101276 [Albimonas donghaensis]